MGPTVKSRPFRWTNKHVEGHYRCFREKKRHGAVFGDENRQRLLFQTIHAQDHGKNETKQNKKQALLR